MRILPGEEGCAAWDERDPSDWEALADHLDDVLELLLRHVAFPTPAAAVASAVWAVHAHLVRLGAFPSTPRLAALSAEKGSGKTRLLEVLELVVPHPVHVVNTSAAAMFRLVEKYQPTLLMDECDTYLGPRVSKEHEEVRALVNAGHRRGAKATRCVGEGGKMDVKEFSAFCAVALAGIGDLPETITQRSIVLKMKRRRPDEVIRPFRARVAEPIGDAIRARLGLWAEANWQRADLMEVAMPTGVVDRPADVWEPLVVMGDAAGSEWSERIRSACSALTADNAADDGSLGVRLLSDIRRVFNGADLPNSKAGSGSIEPVDRMHTEALLARLNALEEAPWGDLRGKEIDARGLAKMLRRYEVTPKDVRIGDVTKKGYRTDELHDAWVRYLPLSP